MDTNYRSLRYFEKTVRHLRETLLIETIASKPLEFLNENETKEECFARHPDFDCLPFKKEGRVSGLFFRNSQKEIQRFELYQIHLISSKTPIYVFLKGLQNKNKLEHQWNFWLVLTDTEIDSIVTIADLILPPVSMLISAHLLYLDSLMSTYILSIAEDSDDWLCLLGDNGNGVPPAEKIRRMHREQKKSYQEIDMVHYATLRQKSTVLRKHSKSKIKTNKEDHKQICHLRNEIAHARPTNLRQIYQIFYKLEVLIIELEKELGIAGLE